MATNQLRTLIMQMNARKTSNIKRTLHKTTQWGCVIAASEKSRTDSDAVSSEKQTEHRALNNNYVTSITD